MLYFIGYMVACVVAAVFFCCLCAGAGRDHRE